MHIPLDSREAGQLRPEARQWLGYLVNQIGFRIRQETAAALAPAGLSPPLLRLLGLIAVDQPMTQVQLAHRSGIDRTSITKWVDQLEARGLAERSRDPGDRRVHALLLTPAGAAALQAGTAAAAEVEQRFLGGLSPVEQEQLLALLARVHSDHSNICPDPEDQETAQ
jgi:DNA-binding MarR family transcriptional regulator